ncbi:MAG: LysR family transcriptional regulator [Gammaproteobacteria bacterium]|nr:LysR family transcriptional regulator [Gammaproteobacteria bacterium]
MVAESETLGGSLEDVRAFCAVIEHGTISAAARTLGGTKGGVSRRVSRLEHRLGVSLLARTPRAVSATEEGAAFYAKARDALALLAEAVQSAQHAQSIPSGHLRITAPLDFGMDILPPLVVAFRMANPQVTVEMLVTDAPLDLAAHRIDLALRATSGDLPDMGYRASTLVTFPIGLYASPGYLAAREPPAAPAKLVEHDLIVPQSFTGAATLSLTNRRGRTEQVALQPVIQTNDFASAHRVLLADGGIGPMPEITVANTLASGTLIRVLPDWTLAHAKLHAISLAGSEAPARVRAFREFIREQLSGRGT